MIKRKVIVEIKDRGIKTFGESDYQESAIITWLEKHERNIPYFGNFDDKLTIIYEEEMEQ